MLQDSPELRPFVLSNVQLTGTRIGAGAYGSVEEVTIHGAVCAAKKIHDIFQDRSEIPAADIQKASSQFVRECQLMSTLRHPHIVQFLGVCFLHGSRLPALVMERLMTSLHDLLDPETDPPPPPDAPKPFFPLSLKCSILHNVASGLAYLHERSEPIIHRDLSARNVLVNSGMVAKIADLGVARIVPREYMRGASTMTKAPGASIYMPPEALEAKSEEEEQSSQYGASIDVFSFGVVSIFTLGQTFPCNLLAPNYRNEHRKIVGRSELERRDRYMQKIYGQLHKNHLLLQMIEQCLDFPEDRPSIGEVLHLLDQARAEERDEQMEMNKLELVRALESQPRNQSVDRRVQTQQQEVADLRQQLQSSEMEKETVRQQLMRKEAELMGKEAELIKAVETIRREKQLAQAKDRELAQAQQQLRQQEQSNRAEISDLKWQLRSSEALVADFQKTLQQRDSESETPKPKERIVPRPEEQSVGRESERERSGNRRGGIMGPLKSLFGKKEMKILMVGLDAAGKTTILYKLKLGEIVTTVPTTMYNVETITFKNINFIVTDVGGRDTNRPSWRNHYPRTQGLIFVVDSNDRERMGEAREELYRMLNEDELRDAMLLVFTNKQDLPNAMNAAEITDKLGLHSLRYRSWYIQATCATSGDGLYEGLHWLSQEMKHLHK